MPYNRATRSADSEPVTNRDVREALAAQAARRPKPTPPQAMPVTPTLPRVRKNKRRRKP
jgi:hypothetical protein